jgi:methylated-DNA-[protein]-cysteine S-methyltransferase
MTSLTCDQARIILTDTRPGDLAPDTAAAVAGHLAECDDCRAQADASRQVRDVLDAIEMPATLSQRLGEATQQHLSRQLRALAFETPLGWGALAYSDGGLVLVRRYDSTAADAYERLRESLGDFITQEKRRDDIGHSAAHKLVDYHAGRRVRFDEPFDLRSASPFGRDVLQATARIPYGEVRPYAWVAREIGRPKAFRAVGQALHINPLAPIIPCHRVIASDNTLGGYGGGPRMKRWLLRLEGYLK